MALSAVNRKQNRSAVWTMAAGPLLPIACWVARLRSCTASSSAAVFVLLTHTSALVTARAAASHGENVQWREPNMSQSDGVDDSDDENDELWLTGIVSDWLMFSDVLNTTSWDVELIGFMLNFNALLHIWLDLFIDFHSIFCVLWMFHAKLWKLNKYCNNK